MATVAVSSSAKSITIDRTKHLNEEPNTGHNRWHPDVRIPGGPFMGVSGVAPSHQQVTDWTRREADVVARWFCPGTQPRRGGSSWRPDGQGRAQHDAAARERRQLRREAAHPRRKVV